MVHVLSLNYEYFKRKLTIQMRFLKPKIIPQTESDATMVCQTGSPQWIQGQLIKEYNKKFKLQGMNRALHTLACMHSFQSSSRTFSIWTLHIKAFLPLAEFIMKCTNSLLLKKNVLRDISLTMGAWGLMNWCGGLFTFGTLFLGGSLNSRSHLWGDQKIIIIKGS